MRLRISLLLFPIVLLSNAFVFSQVLPGPTPTPTPRPGSRQAAAPGVVGDNARYDRLHSIDLMVPKDRAGAQPMLDPKKGIYRRPDKEETAVLAVAESLLARYTAFLNDGDTGIVKLNADSSCISDTDTFVATEKCLPFKMPGAGTSFSFRVETYRVPRLADVILLDGIFKTGGVYQQVIMAEIGDVPIEVVTLETRGMKFLTDLKPVSDSNEFLRFDAEILKGIEADGLLYRKGQPVNVNSTYLLRSIAYRGKYIRSAGGFPYDELDYDRRRDVIVAFRVVGKDANGNITIVWKRFKDVEAPKLKVIK